MDYTLLNYILYGIGFLLMAFIQSLIINGVHECLQGSAIKDDLKGKVFYQGEILYMLAPKFFEKAKHQNWFKPFGGCVKCMSSVFGALTYFPLVIWLFGFQWVQIPIFFADALVLVVLNWLIYKRI